MAATAPAPTTVPVGHPRGLSTLFFTEMWERFSFYGMRAIFVPFMGAAIGEGGLGFDKSASGSMIALYMSAVYMMALPGGWIADKFLGQKRAIVLGGLIIMVGHILLAVPAIGSFYAGLACLVIGTGFLKPNVSTMVGQLYPKDDPRRDGAYSIFYMGINVGAFASPIICGWLAQSDSFKEFLSGMGIDPHWAWHLAFGAAAVGMAVGLIQFWIGRGNLAGVGEPPVITDPAVRRKNRIILGLIGAALVALPLILVGVHTAGFSLTKERISNIFGVLLVVIFSATFVMLYIKAENDRERKAVKAMVALAIGCIAFFALFEQAAGTMNAFAEERTRTVAFGAHFEPSWFQSVNSVFIILLSPLFAAFFIWVVAKKLAFNDIKKFGVALVFMAIAFVVMLPAAGGTDVSPWYLIGFYFFATLAELFLSPVGLSSMSKLAPPSAGGLVMGVWFLSTSNGDWIAGKVHGLTETFSEAAIFEVVIIGALVVAAGMFLAGSYFTKKVPLESLQSDTGTGDVSSDAAAAAARGQITGTGVAGFATAIAIWPVVLTNAPLGAAICVILGPAAVAMAFKGLRECKTPGVGGRTFALAALPIVAGAALFAVLSLAM